MRVELRKSGILRCERADGSVTWQKHTAGSAAFFGFHDLTHFAVETVFGYRNGFFGLIAQGWDVEDLAGKGARGALPAETMEVERFAGALDLERGGGASWNAADFGEMFGITVTEAQLCEVREKRAELFQRWKEVRESMVLEFPDA